jgi:hypothetical protein
MRESEGLEMENEPDIVELEDGMEFSGDGYTFSESVGIVAPRKWGRKKGWKACARPVF